MSMRHYFSRGVFVLLSLVLLCAPFSGCATSSGDSHEVVFWTSVTDDIDIKAENQIAAGFEKANPGYHVKIVGQPVQGTGDNTSLITAVRGGEPPDVFLADRFTVNQQAATGLLTDLSPFIQKENPDLAQQYLPYAWNEVAYGGRPYGLPLDTDARAMFYNKDMVRQAGIDPSVLDPSHGPMSLDQFKQIAFKLNKKNEQGNYTQVGFVPWVDEGWPLTWGLDFGANIFDNANCRMTITEPAMKKALQFYADWANTMGYQAIDAFVATYHPPNAPPSQTPFLTGHSAFTLTGNFTIQGLQEYAPKLHYGITYIPKSQAGGNPFTWSGGFSLVMPKGALNEEGGYRFMRYMTGPEGQRIYTKETGHLPTWASLLNEPGLISGNQQFFAKMLKYSESRPPLPVGAQLWDSLTTAQQAVSLGEQTPEQALQQVENRVQPEMDQYCPYKLDWKRPL